MNNKTYPMWARALIEAGKIAIFLASFFALGTIAHGAINFQPGALLVIGLLAALGLVLLAEEWRRWRDRDK